MPEALSARTASVRGPVTGLVHTGETVQSRINAAMRAVLSAPTPATALVTGNVTTTFAILTYLAAEVAPEHRPALVGFDDFPLAQLLDPGITVLAQQPAQMGRLAAQLLFGRLAGDDTPAAAHVIPSRLIPRGSGEIPAP